MGRLGQETTVTEEQVIAMLKETQRQETSLRQRYVELMAWVNLGSVPGVIVRHYIEAATTMNQLLARNTEMFKEAGGTGVFTPVPMIGVNRDYKDDEALTPADLSFDPCPQQPMTLGWQWVAVELIKGAVAVLCVGGVIWGLKEVNNLVRSWKGSDVKIAYYNQYLGVTQEQTKQLEIEHAAFDKQMTACLEKGKTWVACVPEVATIITKIRAGVTKPAGEPESGLGFFGWLGVIVFVGGIGAVGYAIWKRQRGRGQVQVTEKSSESALRREAVLPGE
jgi:hypothetical protein